MEHSCSSAKYNSAINQKKKNHKYMHMSLKFWIFGLCKEVMTRKQLIPHYQSLLSETLRHTYHHLSNTQSLTCNTLSMPLHTLVKTFKIIALLTPSLPTHTTFLSFKILILPTSIPLLPSLISWLTLHTHYCPITQYHCALSHPVSALPSMMTSSDSWE